MSRLICVTGATGNQGGSVAKLLLQYPDQYKVRAVTRRPDSDAATQLRDLGAEVVKADLNVEIEVAEAVKGCWGVFAVTSSYDAVSLPNPSSNTFTNFPRMSLPILSWKRSKGAF